MSDKQADFDKLTARTLDRLIPLIESATNELRGLYAVASENNLGDNGTRSIMMDAAMLLGSLAQGSNQAKNRQEKPDFVCEKEADFETILSKEDREFLAELAKVDVSLVVKLAGVSATAIAFAIEGKEIDYVSFGSLAEFIDDTRKDIAKKIWGAQ